MAYYRGDPDVYFANLPAYSEEYLNALVDKVNIYREYCETKGKASSWTRKLTNYFGISADGTKSSSQVTRGGDQGQLVMGKVNDFRNLLQHQIILVTSQRPAGIAKAANSDTKSLKSARIGSLLTEYYLSQVGWEKTFVKGVEMMKIADESYFVLDYDPTAGEPIRPKVDEDGNPIAQKVMTGDTLLRVIPPWHMVRDVYLGDPSDMHWGIYSWRINKFDLIAKFPQFADDILKAPNAKIHELQLDQIEDKQTDMTRVYCLSHEPTQACPTGRLTLFIPDKILTDNYTEDGYPYPEFNIYRMAENDIVESSFGYTNNNDLLALEEITDAMHSMIFTNQITLGVNGIVAAHGTNLQHTEIAKGLPYFECDPAHIDKIKTLELCKTAPEIFTYLQSLDAKKETLAGINSVVRGDPEGALRSNSGSALALVQAQSLQFNSGGQRAYYLALSKVNTGNLKFLAKYAKQERIVQIVGSNQAQYIEEFSYTGKDLEGVSSIVFEAVDPAMQSAGAKVGIAENLLQKGLIKNARQYVTVLRTGNLDVFTEDDEADELGVKSENERFRKGQWVSVLKTENHEEHINSHKSILASPEAKEDGPLVQYTLAHVQKHIDWWNWLSLNNPALLIATGQKVLPPSPGSAPGGPDPEGNPGIVPPPPPQGQPMGPEQPSHPASAPMGPNGPPQGAGAGPAGISKVPVNLMNGGKPPVQTKAGDVHMPNFPMNPATGQRAVPPGMPSA